MEAAIQTETQDYQSPYGGPNAHQILPTEKQMRFARSIAQSGGLVLPWEAQQSRRSLSPWIDAHASVLAAADRRASLPSLKRSPLLNG